MEVKARQPLQAEVEVSCADIGFVGPAVDGQQQRHGMLGNGIGGVGGNTVNGQPSLAGFHVHIVEAGAAQNQYLYPQLAELIHNGSGDGVIYKYANGVIACGQGSGILVETGFKEFDFQAGIRGIVLKAGNIVGFGVKKSYFHGILPPEWI